MTLQTFPRGASPSDFKFNQVTNEDRLPMKHMGIGGLIYEAASESKLLGLNEVGTLGGDSVLCYLVGS